MKPSTEAVFQTYADRLFAIAFTVCQNREDAEDVMQDTLIRYCAAKREFESEEHIKAWLIRVAINRAKDLYFNSRWCWDEMVRRDMDKILSWENSAKQYKELYLDLAQ